MKRLLLVLLLASACVPKGRTVEDAPDWETERGRRELKYELIEAFLGQHEPDKAMTLIAQLHREDDDSPVLQLYQGQALMQDGMSGEAERVLLTYQKDEPKDPRSFRLLGALYADDKRIDEGITALQQAIALDDHDAATWNNTGFLLMAVGRNDDAITALERAIDLDGTQPRYRNNLGFALAAVGRWGDALEAFSSAGTPADAHSNLALAYELQGDTTDALEHYERALKYNPSHVDALDGKKRLLSPDPEAPPASPLPAAAGEHAQESP